MNETCEKNLVKARNAIAENNDKTALEALDEIDPESNCYKSAQKLNQELNVKSRKHSGRGKHQNQFRDLF